jgi:CBS domain-containing protein
VLIVFGALLIEGFSPRERSVSMTATQTSLLDLTAADLMTQPAVVLPQEMSMRAAAQKLLEDQVHGAPVVDRDGNCVGVLSTTDFLYWTKQCRKRPGAVNGALYFSPWRIVDPDDIPEDAVRNYMTADPVSVSPTATISELAQMMLDAQIHRLIVVTEGMRPVGIVACTDILAAVVRAGRNLDD